LTGVGRPSAGADPPWEIGRNLSSAPPHFQAFGCSSRLQKGNEINTLKVSARIRNAGSTVRAPLVPFNHLAYSPTTRSIVSVGIFAHGSFGTRRDTLARRSSCTSPLLPTRLEAADLLLPRARADAEQSHPLQVRRECPDQYRPGIERRA
jgi:hypothetical protein